MRTRALVVATILVTAGLAGCLGLGGDDGGAETAGTDEPPTVNETNETTNDTVDDVEEAEPEIEVHWQNATVAGQDIPGLGWLCNPCQDNEMTFNATNETTAIVAQLFWEKDLQLDADLDMPYDPCDPDLGEDCPPDPETGTSPIEYRLTNSNDVHAGEWHLTVYPENNPNDPAEVTMVVGVFETDEPPRRWSRVPSG